MGFKESRKGFKTCESSVFLDSPLIFLRIFCLFQLKSFFLLNNTKGKRKEGSSSTPFKLLEINPSRFFFLLLLFFFFFFFFFFTISFDKIHS